MMCPTLPGLGASRGLSERHRELRRKTKVRPGDPGRPTPYGRLACRLPLLGAKSSTLVDPTATASRSSRFDALFGGAAGDVAVTEPLKGPAARRASVRFRELAKRRETT